MKILRHGYPATQHIDNLCEATGWTHEPIETHHLRHPQTDPTHAEAIRVRLHGLIDVAGDLWNEKRFQEFCDTVRAARVAVGELIPLVKQHRQKFYRRLVERPLARALPDENSVRASRSATASGE